MSLPTVAIVGRPNVGKSSIFNWLVGRKLAIVDSVAGITRDRMIRVVEHEGSYFELIDTGGVGINDVDELSEEIEQQISSAINLADVVLFVVDIREGLAPLDDIVAKRLHAIGKPIIFCANKADNDKHDWSSSDYYSLGLGEPLCVSVQNFRRKYDLLDQIVEQLPKADADEVKVATEEPELKIAIVGKRNVGKSTFINSLCQTDRMIASEVPGTTRDSVDIRVQVDGKTIVLIDTPGFRKRKSVRTDIEFYSTHRAQRSIRYADLTLLFFDSAEEISKVDKQLINYIELQQKPVVFVVNKWDLVADKIVTEQWAEYVRDEFPSLWYVPVAFITGIEGRNIKRLLNLAQMLYKQSRWRVPTAALNRLIRQAMLLHPPAMRGPSRPRIYFATQIGIQPPTVILKCSDPESFDKTYRRYLMGVLRDQLRFGEVPIRMFLEKRENQTSEDQQDQGLSVKKDLVENDLLDLENDEIGRWVQENQELDKKAKRRVQKEAGLSDEEIQTDTIWNEVAWETAGDAQGEIEAEEYVFPTPEEDDPETASENSELPEFSELPENFDDQAMEEIFEIATEEQEEERKQTSGRKSNRKNR